MDVEPDWKGLAREIRARREKLRLPQDLTSVGGPSALTVRKFERAEATTIRNKTKTQLERALRWHEGRVDLVLAGEDSTDNNPRVSVETPDGIFLTGVHDIEFTDTGTNVRFRNRVVDVSDELDPENPIVDAIEPADGEDRLVAKAYVEVLGGSLWVAGVNGLLKKAPWHVVAGALVSRLMSAGSEKPGLTRAQHNLLRAAVPAYKEAMELWKRRGDD